MFLARVCRAASYVKPLEVALWKQDRMLWAVQNFVCIRQHREFLVKYESQVTPTVLCASLSFIYHAELPLDEHWPEVMKIVKRTIANYDMYAIRHLYRCARYLGLMNERNDEFWDIIEQKLVKENLHRYLTEYECARLIRALAQVGKGSPELWERLERQLKLFKNLLNADDIEEVLDAQQLSSRLSEETLAAIRESPQYPEVKALT